MRRLPAGYIKRIHVAQPVIRARKPNPLRVKTSSANEPAEEIRILHGGEVVATILYRPENPLSCGARVWIETTAEVELEAAPESIADHPVYAALSPEARRQIARSAGE